MLNTLRSVTCLAILASALLIGGCASAPNVDLDTAHKASLKRVAVLGITEPAEIQLANLGGAASAFGLIGGLVQASTNIDHTKQFTAALKQQHAVFAAPLEQAISTELKSAGFTVIAAHDQKAKLSADKKSDDFTDVHVDADAILQVGYGVIGYISEPTSRTYQPWLVIKAHLVDAKTRKDLYFKAFVVGWKMKIENTVYFPADAKFRFKSFDDVMSHVPAAANDLLESQQQVARQIGANLRS